MAKLHAATRVCEQRPNKLGQLRLLTSARCFQPTKHEQQPEPTYIPLQTAAVAEAAAAAAAAASSHTRHT